MMRTGWPIWLAATLAAGWASAAAASEPSAVVEASPSCLLGPDQLDYPDDPLPGTASTSAKIAGTYDCTEEGVRILLQLDPSGTYTLRLSEPGGPETSGEEVRGRWRLQGHLLYMIDDDESDPECLSDGSICDLPYSPRGYVADLEQGWLVVGVGLGAALVRRIEE